MKTYYSRANKMLFASVAFTLILLAARTMATHQNAYAFYPWNIFLALIPLLASRILLNQKKFGILAIICLFVWLLFLPNAPYLITDLFHFTRRAGYPAWFDLVMVSSASWNGIIIATLTLMQVEQFLKRHFNHKWVLASLLVFIALCGYGVYLGRFHRFNSWDIVVKPAELAGFIKNSLIHPHRNLTTWIFTMVFGGMFGMMFFTIRGLSGRGPVGGQLSAVGNEK